MAELRFENSELKIVIPEIRITTEFAVPREQDTWEI